LQRQQRGSHHHSSTELVIGCASARTINWARVVFESIYQACLAFELTRAGLQFDEQGRLNHLRGTHLPGAFRADFIVEREVIVEVKSIERVPLSTHGRFDLHAALGLKKGLLINFNVTLLKYGFESFVM
jgi:GxxExxY protein